MNINIGETISKIRKEKFLTQEQLSEVFGVSVAAVSKWETGVAHPDIELLPKIAEFFDISVDCLLGYDRSKLETTIEECLGKAIDLLDSGHEKEAIAYYGTLAYRFPNNVRVLAQYGEAKVRAVHGIPKTEEHKRLYREAEEILLSINQNGITRHEQDIILKALFYIYLWEKKFDKAEKIVTDLTPKFLWYVDNAEFWLYIHKGDMEKAKEIYYHILEKNLLYDPFGGGQHHIHYDEPEKVIALNNKFIKVMELFGEDFSSFPYWKILGYHESNAFMYAKLGKNEEALKEIEEIARIARESGKSYEPFTNLIKRKESDEPAVVFIKDAYKKLTEN